MAKNRRKYRRVEASIRVAFRTKEELAVEYTKNISKGGIFLKTDQLVDPNAEIDLTISFPEGSGEYKIKGQVTRLMSVSRLSEEGENDQLFGVGIRFLNPADDLLRAVEQVINKADPDSLKNE